MVMKDLNPVTDVSGMPDPYTSRPHGAPAYYQGRPASLWIKVMKPRRRRKVIDRTTSKPANRPMLTASPHLAAGLLRRRYSDHCPGEGAGQ